MKIIALAKDCCRCIGGGPYDYTRQLMLRAVGFAYFCAFFPLHKQALGLIGSNGIMPARVFLLRYVEYAGGLWEAFLQLPSIFFFFPSDTSILIFSYLGILLSTLLILGRANALTMIIMWFLQMSFVHAGQDFWGFGWETNLLEIGFLSIFLCPIWRWDIRDYSYSSPVGIFVLYRWVLFRLMFGAGMIKLRGDSCWTDLSCLQFHYETQPIPNPLSPFFHFAPVWFHNISVVLNHIVELIIPWFLFLSRRFRIVAGVIFIFFQLSNIY